MATEHPFPYPDDPLSAIAEAVSPSIQPSGSRPFDLAFARAPKKRLWALSDLHLSYKANREALEELRPKPNDWIILCGDLGETVEHLELGFKKAKECFAEVFWCPGNHELYTLASKKDGKRGVNKYMECVEVARRFGVWTPEDPFQLWDGDGSDDGGGGGGASGGGAGSTNGQDDNTGLYLIAPIFTLYDYSFRPPDIKTTKEALEWAKEQGIEATDEHLLHPDPFPSREAWCGDLLKTTAHRLSEAASTGIPLIIVNHWPLRYDVVNLLNVPRFSLWCGSKATDNWHLLYNSKIVVSGHLHVRRTDWIDGVRFEEVSLGYPKQWKECRDRGLDINDMLREILPGPKPPEEVAKGQPIPTQYRKYG